MKRKLISISSALVVTTMMSACSTEFYSTSIDPQAPSGTKVNGIPFRILQPHLMTVYKKTLYGYVRVTQVRNNLPNQNQIYVLGLDGQLLSDATLKVQLNGDGTLKLVETSAVGSKITDVITALGVAVSPIDSKLTTEHSNRQTAKTNKINTELDNGPTVFAQPPEAAF